MSRHTATKGTGSINGVGQHRMFVVCDLQIALIEVRAGAYRAAQCCPAGGAGRAASQCRFAGPAVPLSAQMYRGIVHSIMRPMVGSSPTGHLHGHVGASYHEHAIDALTAAHYTANHLAACCPNSYAICLSSSLAYNQASGTAPVVAACVMNCVVYIL
ncbi:hypothetical protein HaLaN_02043 [Haematococcus lacustris]|uniref:Uncharacterized protein n=1 Tax=Haematococcus lacustris TaxID=44745 RepID=A0A699YW43_HAELA|nr:hypothetical protein HaLaN_02043 [Haematococcus lacustris]